MYCGANVYKVVTIFLALNVDDWIWNLIREREREREGERERERERGRGRGRGREGGYSSVSNISELMGEISLDWWKQANFYGFSKRKIHFKCS